MTETARNTEQLRKALVARRRDSLQLWSVSAVLYGTVEI